MKKLTAFLLMLILAAALTPLAARAADDSAAEPAGETLEQKLVRQTTEALDAGDTDRALKIIEEAILVLNGSAKADAYNTRALVYQRLGRLDDAFKDVESAMKLVPDDYLPFATRAVLYHDSGEYALAAADLDHAIALGTNNPADFTTRGDLFLSQNNLTAAVKMYSAAIGADAGYPDAYFQRAYAYSELGYFDEALADYDKAVALAPQTADVYNNRGIMYGRMGRFEDALRDMKTALDLDPRSAASHSNYAYTLFEKGDALTALEELDKADLLEKNNPYSLCNRAEAYLNLGRTAKARGALKKCVKAAQEDAFFSEQEPYYIEAMSRVKKRLDSGTDIPSREALAAEAAAALEKNNLFSAFISLNLVNILKPDAEDTLLPLGEVCARLGMYPHANTYLHVFIALYPDSPGVPKAREILAKIKPEL